MGKLCGGNSLAGNCKVQLEGILCFWVGHFKSSLVIIFSIVVFMVLMQTVSVGYEYLNSYTRVPNHRIFNGVVPSLRQNHCDVTGVKFWKENMVTLLQPRIEANCSSLVAGNETEFMKVKEKLRTWKNAQPEEEFLKGLDNCSHIMEEYINNFYISPEEESFPLAYILVVYTNVRQVLRLLKVIYRPHNLYCIHPDAKQKAEFITAFLCISRCLSNVFIASKLEKVYYQHHSIMDAQLNCMEDLMKFDLHRWKYAINLCGRELPLKTNREIVQSLMKLNGSSVIKANEISEADLDRFHYKVSVFIFGYTFYRRTNPGPTPIKIYKAMKYMAITRPFMSFLLNNETAIALRKYLKDVLIPEEHFYGSLYKLPNVPGGPPRKPNVKIPSVYKTIWLTSGHNEPCKGREVHGICVVSSGDLPLVYSMGLNPGQPVFFFNKYFMEWDHVVMDCTERRLVEMNKLEYEQDCLI